MDRVRDYLWFVVWFLGLAYIAALPLLLPDSGVLAGAQFCAGATRGLLHWFCARAEPRLLPPGLHGLGMIAAAAVILQLPMLALRGRRRRSFAPPLRPSAPQPSAPQRSAPRPWVTPRRHFGMRGVPRQ
jgi:hypothetical protein